MANENNDLNVRQYQLEFKKMLQTVFAKEAYFGDFFAGGIEALDGVQENETAFAVKTCDIPVVVGDAYNTDANTAFGTGTGNSTRFGERTEVIYTNTPVPYTWGWVYHEGIDRHTVNNDFEAAVADRTLLQAQAKTQEFNAHHAAFISESAAKTISGGVTAKNLLDVFDELYKYFVNIGARGTKVAKVTADVWNLIINSDKAVTGKNSGANIDNNNITKFKDFIIEVLPESAFAGGDVIYAYIAGVGKAFTGINSARTIESEDFDGVAFQGAGKAGEFILPANKKAVAKVTSGDSGNP